MVAELVDGKAKRTLMARSVCLNFQWGRMKSLHNGDENWSILSQNTENLMMILRDN